MQNSQIVKKRLQDLKRLSQNLKQSTQVRADIDVNLLKTILSITKTSNINDGNEQVGKSRSQESGSMRTLNGVNSQENLSVQSGVSHKLKKTMSASLIQKYISNKPQYLSSSRTKQPDSSIRFNQQIQPLFEQPDDDVQPLPITTNTTNSKPNYNNNQIDDNVHIQEIIHLREENNRLEVELREIKEKLDWYKDRDEGRSRVGVRGSGSRTVEDSSHNPFFQIQEEIQTYVTKLRVDKQDYPKIQYTTQLVQLTLDKILIKKQSKSGNLTDPSNATPIRQLQLSNLVSVTYLEDSRIVFVFSDRSDKNDKQKDNAQINDDVTRMFLKFDGADSLHRWDLATYINYKTVTNLNKDKLFNTQFIQNSNKTQQPPELQQDQQTIIRKLSQNNQKQLLNEPTNQQYKKQEKQALKQYIQNKRKFIQSQKNLKLSMLKKINIMKSGINTNSVNMQMYRNRNTEFVKPNSQNSVDLGAEIKKQRVLEDDAGIRQGQSQLDLINKQQQNKLAQQRKKQQQLTLLKQKQTQHIQQSISTLKKGLYMTKYSKSAFSPHDKRVYISQDNTKLCWQDKGKDSDFKFVLVSDIESVQRGELGPGVLKHVDRGKVANVNCFITIGLRQGAGRERLEFGMASLRLMEEFEECLLVFLGEYRKGNLGPK